MKENYLKEELYDLIKSESSIFEFIQSVSLDGIWYWDLKNPENEWLSPKFWEVLGYDADEKTHQASEWKELIFPEDLILATENLKRHCADAQHPYDQIVRYKHRNGSTIWIRCRGLAIRDETGKAIRMLGAHTDITALKEAEKEIVRLNEEYGKVFHGTQDAMFLVKVSGEGSFRYLRTNLAHQKGTGIPQEQIINRSPQELLGQERGDLLAKNYQKCVDSKKRIQYEEALSLPGGERVWLTTLTPILDEDRVTNIVGSSSDITERKKIEWELDRYANYDQLTGLPNRRLFFERLERLIREKDHHQFALLFIDVDGLKRINDNHGHKVGDEVLVIVGERLLQCIQESDMVARIGGDEFTVVIQNIEDAKSVDAFIAHMHQALQSVMDIEGAQYRVDSSIGVAIYPHHGDDSETLLKNADSSMYEIKRNGKGGFKFFTNWADLNL